MYIISSRHCRYKDKNMILPLNVSENIEIKYIFNDEKDYFFNESTSESSRGIGKCQQS